MDGIAIKAMVSELAPVVREYVAAETAPLLARIAALEADKAALTGRCEALEGKADKPVEIDLIQVEKMIEAEIAKLPVPEPAQEIDRNELVEAINLAVGEAVAALPPPEKGEKGEAGEKGLDGSNGADGRDGQDGKDAANIVEALKDSGELVLTLQDGRLIRTGIRDGEKGIDGADGLGFDDLDVCVLDDDRTIEFAFRRGDEEKAFTLKWPTVIDRGVFKTEREIPYEPGDGVTWGGQFFICNEQTVLKPDQSKDGKPWRLAVRKGRDGKDAKHG